MLPSSSSFGLNIHSSQKLQISGLIAEEAPIEISSKSSNFADIFSSDLASKLFEHTVINDHTIELVDG